LDSFKRWLVDEIISKEHRVDRLREALLQRCRELRVEPPASERGNVRLSRPGELHPQPLREPDVNPSAHPAPTTQP
jgi:MoxR-like ATPase